MTKRYQAIVREKNPAKQDLMLKAMTTSDKACQTIRVAEIHAKRGDFAEAEEQLVSALVALRSARDAALDLADYTEQPPKETP